MRIGILQKTMWTLFRPTFQKNLSLLGVKDGRTLMSYAKKRYEQILKDIPEYGENDVLLVNLLNAAMYAAIYLSLDKKPDIDTLADYYEQSMNTNPVMRLFLGRSDQFTQKYQERQKTLAKKSQRSDNPYTWRFSYYPGATPDSFDAIFDRCGIWHMMQVLGIPEATPVVCRYDYGMTRLTGAEFSREQTLAEGGTVCDCHYRKRI